MKFATPCFTYYLKHLENFLVYFGGTLCPLISLHKRGGCCASSLKIGGIVGIKLRCKNRSCFTTNKIMHTWGPYPTCWRTTTIHGVHVNPSLKKKNLLLQRKFSIPKWCSSASACRFLLGYNQSLEFMEDIVIKRMWLWRNQSHGRATINPMPLHISAHEFAHVSTCLWHASSAFIQLPVCLAQHNLKMRIKNPGLLFKSFKEKYHSVCALLQQHKSEQKKLVLLFQG